MHDVSVVIPFCLLQISAFVNLKGISSFIQSIGVDYFHPCIEFPEKEKSKINKEAIELIKNIPKHKQRNKNNLTPRTEQLIRFQIPSRLPVTPKGT